MNNEERNAIVERAAQAIESYGNNELAARLRSTLAAEAPGAMPVAHVVDIDRNCNESIIDVALPPGTALYAACTKVLLDGC